MSERIPLKSEKHYRPPPPRTKRDRPGLVLVCFVLFFALGFAVGLLVLTRFSPLPAPDVQSFPAPVPSDWRDRNG